MRLAWLISLLLIACSNRAITANDAGADLAPNSKLCPAQQPATTEATCFAAPTCTVPNAVCHYGGETCTCIPNIPGAKQGGWFCNPDACATATSGPHGECNADLTCCGAGQICTCTYVCTSRVWTCISEGGNDMSVVPGVDMCP